MGSQQCEIYGGRRRESMVTAIEPLRLHPRKAYSNGYKRMAETDATSLRVSHHAKPSIGKEDILITVPVTSNQGAGSNSKKSTTTRNVTTAAWLPTTLSLNTGPS